MTNPNPWSVKSKTFGRQRWLGIFIDCSLSFNEQIPKVNWIILIPDTQKYQVIHSILHRAKDQAWNQQSTLTCSRHYQQQVVYQVRHLCGVLKGNLCHDDCRWDSWPDRKHNCNHRPFKVNCVHTVWWWCDNLILDKKKGDRCCADGVYLAWRWILRRY